MWPVETGIQEQLPGTLSVYTQMQAGSLCTYIYLYCHYWTFILNCQRVSGWGSLCSLYLCEGWVCSPVQPAVYICTCVAYVCSMCICPLGIHAQPHYLVRPGLGTVAVLPLSHRQLQPCSLTRNTSGTKPAGKLLLRWKTVRYWATWGGEKSVSLLDRQPASWPPSAGRAAGLFAAQNILAVSEITSEWGACLERSSGWSGWEGTNFIIPFLY